jgi:hypothetical protein
MEAWRTSSTWNLVTHDTWPVIKNTSPASLPYHKEYVTFRDDKKGKVLGIGVIKVNDFLTLNDVALMDRLTYNLHSVSQLVDADLSVLFHKSDSRVLD